MRTAMIVLLVAGIPSVALGSTCGTYLPCCDTDPDPGDGTFGTSEQACVNALLFTFGPDVVVHDIFHTSDSPPLKARDLDNQGRLAKLLTTNFTSCIGGITADGNTVSNIGYVCDYGTFWGCDAGVTTPACAPPDGGVLDLTYEGHYNGEHVDEAWLQAERGAGDGDATHFDPSLGLQYDLGGPSNKVVVFAVTDHGPFPCESFEYEVFVTNNPAATEIADPAQNCAGLIWTDGGATDGTPPCAPGVTDPSKWNRTVLYKAFLGGWNDDPLPDGGTRWDPDAGIDYVGDGYTMVFTLPCGITFRYASLVPGNAGNPAQACTFFSGDYELDAVAGLNQDESSVCPDEDGDGYPDCACTPVSENRICDCDDSDPTVHPGAAEDCGSDKDYGCLGGIPQCPAGSECLNHSCLKQCAGELGCPNGQSCVDGYCAGQSCQNTTCSGNEVCFNGQCVDPCQGAICPPGQTCQLGQCVDLCARVACPEGQVCQVGVCSPSCACLASACTVDQACDPDAGVCVESTCLGVNCAPGQLCQAGACVDTCSIVQCPAGTQCDAGSCLSDPCFNVFCAQGSVCVDGTCLDACAQAGHPCNPGFSCVSGTCERTNASSSGSSGSHGSTGATGTVGTSGTVGGVAATGAHGATGTGSTGSTTGTKKVAVNSCNCSQADGVSSLLALLGALLAASRRRR
jgi:uncharacterized protein (TIGR03382 family)